MKSYNKNLNWRDVIEGSAYTCLLIMFKVLVVAFHGLPVVFFRSCRSPRGESLNIFTHRMTLRN